MSKLEDSYKNKNFHYDNLYFDTPKQYDSIDIYQVGDLSCKGNYEIKAHKQLCYEISYIESGKGICYINDEEFQVEKGDIFLNLPGEIHKLKADKLDPFRFMYLGFVFNSNLSIDDRFFHAKKMFDNRSLPLVKDRLNISTAFFNLLSETKNVDDFSHLMIETYIFQIITLTYRNFFENWEYTYEFKEEMSSAKEMVYNVVNFIDSNIFNITDLGIIADSLGYSYSHLSHTFSEETGLTLKAYYSKKRLQKATDLLKEGHKTITQIAYMLNFQSIHSFSRTFKKEIGISPSEYQKIHGKSATSIQSI